MADHGGKDILSSDVEIKGSIKFQKELLIDGKVEGDINSDGVLTVGENAEIRGEIKTKSITVYGKVHGNITVAERCELKSKCTLQGDLKAARLIIEEGATFIGNSEVTTGALVPSPKAPGACATRARVGFPFPSTVARYTSKVPLLPPGVLPAETVGTYTQPPEPGQAAGFPQTPPYGPSR